MELEQFKKLLERDRSVRRYDETRLISHETLVSLVGLTRYCASGRNAQPLRYRLVTEPDERAGVFEHLAWAGYYKDWAGPDAGERPTAYLIQCRDTMLGEGLLCDDGLQLQAITLGATTLGISCCIIKAFNPKGIADALDIDPRYKPHYVLALGYAAEKVKLVEMQPDGDFKYYRDKDDTQCVPKRPLEQLIIG